jgi:hypothetical protein
VSQRLHPDSHLPKLAAADIRRLDQLTQFSEADIKQLHGIGPSTIKQLRRALAERGLSFAA